MAKAMTKPIERMTPLERRWWAGVSFFDPVNRMEAAQFGQRIILFKPAMACSKTTPQNGQGECMEARVP